MEGIQAIVMAATGSKLEDETALLMLKEMLIKCNSREERERLDQLEWRLSEERLLFNTSARELIDLYDRYSDGESLDSIVTSIKCKG